MNKSKTVFKRVRPLLGTFVEISLLTEGLADAVVTAAFTEAEALEKIFNLKDPAAEIHQSQSSDKILLEVGALARGFFEQSGGAFYPYQPKSEKWDLNGIAKGYIVDRMVQNLNRNAVVSGSINAGGDIRFFNCPQKSISLRLGPADQPVFRELRLTREAVCTSSLTVSHDGPRSSTVYHQKLKRGLTPAHSVTVLADDCATADALAKVGLFAESEVAQHCCLFYKAQMLVFDSAGELIETFGDHEN